MKNSNKLKSYKLLARNGVAALPSILLLGGLIVEIIIAATLSSYLLVNSEFGARSSTEALSAAKSGVQDAMLKIVRDKRFTSSYTLSVGSASSQITICKDLPAPDCAGIGKHKIIAIGKSGSRQRKLEAVLVVSAADGMVKLESLKEIEL